MVIIIFYNALFAQLPIPSSDNINVPTKSIVRVSSPLNALIFSHLNLLIIYQSIGFIFRFGDFWGISA